VPNRTTDVHSARPRLGVPTLHLPLFLEAHADPHSRLSAFPYRPPCLRFHLLRLFPHPPNAQPKSQKGIQSPYMVVSASGFLQVSLSEMPRPVTILPAPKGHSLGPRHFRSRLATYRQVGAGFQLGFPWVAPTSLLMSATDPVFLAPCLHWQLIAAWAHTWTQIYTPRARYLRSVRFP
jgi:hypothetical protein